MANRAMSREHWRILWRELRIARRETRKAWVDLQVFGTGVVEIQGRQIRYVPLGEFRG